MHSMKKRVKKFPIEYIPYRLWYNLINVFPCGSCPPSNGDPVGCYFDINAFL